MEAAEAKPMWPRRSRHFLRLGRTRFAPLLLFVQPKHFSSDTFDQVLSFIYDKLPQEVILDPHKGFQTISSPFVVTRPCHISNAGLHFCYYWLPTEAPYSLLVPKEKQLDTLSGGVERDHLESANMTLVVCVTSCPNPDLLSQIEKNDELEADPLIDMSGLARPALVSQYFPKATTSATAASTALAMDQAVAIADNPASSSSNTKKRKRDPPEAVHIID